MKIGWRQAIFVPVSYEFTHLLQGDYIPVNGLELLNHLLQLVAPLNVPLHQPNGLLWVSLLGGLLCRRRAEIQH